MVGKQDGGGCNRAYGLSDEDVIGKNDGAMRKGSMWLQQC